MQRIWYENNPQALLLNFNLVNPESDKGLQSKSYNIQIIENKTMNTQPMPDATIRTNTVCKAFFSRPSWLRSETQPAQQEIQIPE
jgi:hypothetical protein